MGRQPLFEPANLVVSPDFASMNKNWNDRADKDLFFTILSVKNIGVISGAEWTTIGNTMRALGYGFTNEGCRQHFQGLRRAQNKAEANGGGTGSSQERSADPTLNPITRRPGPGRGRPRKHPADMADLSMEHSPHEPPAQAQMTPQMPMGTPMGQSPVAQTPAPVPMSVSAMPDQSMSGTDPTAMPSPVNMSGMPLPVPMETPEGLPLPSNGDDSEGQHAAKRPRLDDPINQDEPTSQDVLDEDTVLQLAADPHTGGSYPSPGSFNYGEA